MPVLHPSVTHRQAESEHSTSWAHATQRWPIAGHGVRGRVAFNHRVKLFAITFFLPWRQRRSLELALSTLLFSKLHFFYKLTILHKYIYSDRRLRISTMRACLYSLGLFVLAACAQTASSYTDDNTGIIFDRYYHDSVGWLQLWYSPARDDTARISLVKLSTQAMERDMVLSFRTMKWLVDWWLWHGLLMKKDFSTQRD